MAAQIAFGLPNQIRALRSERKLTQGDLAKLAKMAQPRICEMERPGERKLNLDTLMRLAAAFDVALEVRFLPFGELVERSEHFDPDSFSVKSFDDEVVATIREAEPEKEAWKSINGEVARLHEDFATSTSTMQLQIQIDSSIYRDGDTHLRALQTIQKTDLIKQPTEIFVSSKRSQGSDPRRRHPRARFGSRVLHGPRAMAVA